MNEARSTIEAFGQSLLAVGQERSEVVALVADTLKSMGVLPFKQACPERVFDLGIAEQNMMMAAAGLASTGKIPFVASYAVFLSMRTLEQIRTFIAYPGLKVRVVAGLGGLSGAFDGVTHQGTEDLSIMRAIPGMTVINPADAVSVERAVRALVDWPGPAYLRLARVKTPVLFGEDYQFQIGKANLLRPGGAEVALIATGLPVRLALEAADLLKRDGISASVLECHTLKPIDREALLVLASQCGAAVTIEENNIVGGLGSAVAETLSEAHPIPIVRVGIRDCYSESASQDQLCEQAGLTV
ncbi:MAG TPA: transketolase C-terminal domain-containing protein, partial [Candidatus Methylomirabilis sp.]